MVTRFPTAVDTIVVGAGTAGAVVAGRLAAGSTERTLLLEAGPDYGPADSGRWPRDLLDATSSALWSHDWGYTGEFGGRVIHYNRARVVGGCSSHNAGAVVFGSRFDYDGWAAAGNAGWSARELAPLFASAWEQLRVRSVGLDELTPFQRACRDAIAAHGIPAVEDLNDLDQNVGVAPFPVNIDGIMRVNSAFGYVDPVRDRLTVAGDAPVERVLVRGGRAVGVAVRDGERLVEIGASRVVLSGGAYGSPAILLRSGIGPADELIAIGVKPALDLPGVGRNLHDQPCLEVFYEGSDDLIEQMERHLAETGWRPDEQVIAKFPSAGCPVGFDLHIYPVGGRSSRDVSKWSWFLGVACLTPRSRGSVRLTGPSLDDELVIDHRYLSDSGGHDRARLAEGVERVREVAEMPELRRLLGRETRPGPEVSGREAIERFLDHAAVHYYHPAGTCKMGPPSDPDAVVDANGRVHGIEGLYVADASLMPTVTSGNTNMPTAVIGERIARSCLTTSTLPEPCRFGCRADDIRPPVTSLLRTAEGRSAPEKGDALMKLLLTSAGIKNASIRSALVDLLGKPIAESSALCIPTAVYATGGSGAAWQFVTGRASTPMCELGWKSLGVLELTALPSIDQENWVPMVQETDALLVAGGDATYLCYWMRQSGLADLLPSLRAVWVGLSGGSMVMTPSIGADFVSWSRADSDRALGVVDFAIFPHLDHENFPDNSMASAEMWAASMPVPSYAIDDQTAIKVTDGGIEVVSEGHWKLFTP